jgi:hypothetical protein
MRTMTMPDGTTARPAANGEAKDAFVRSDASAALSSLPPPTTKRWVIRRKAAVVAAVRGGLLTLEDACQRYTLSTEEFLSWQRLIDRHGMRGLRATRLQDYRAGRPQDAA